jgi:hypothetical protein
MSDTPSWLTEENIAVAASNPAAQQAAVKVASNPAVQQAAISAASNPAVQQAAYNAVAPSWATSGGGYAPPPPPAGDVEAQQVRRTEAPPANLDIPPEVLKQMERYALFLRVFYICCAVLMSTAAWLYILGGDTNFTKIFIAFYVFFFAILISCFEIALPACSRMIASNFGFLYNGLGRGIFLVFAAALSFNLKVIGIVAMSILLLGVVINIYIVFKFPKYTAWLRRKHYEVLHT